MIDISKLTDSDIGRYVRYLPFDKMLTEKQAWEFCAKAWSDAIDPKESIWLRSVKKVVVFRETEQAGLCGLIPMFVFDVGIRCRMLEKIAKLKSISHDGFKFTPDAKGAKLRVKFCKRMIKELKKNEQNARASE